MILPSYKKIITLITLNDVEKELLFQQKSLAELKTNNFIRAAVRGVTPRSFKFVLQQPHVKTHVKRRIAQLKYQESILKKKK